MIREIVTIDEEKCDGCGLCIPACEEGAIKLVDGKAKLVADRMCDGMGACLGHCPRGAITIERREADEFDEAAVAAHTHAHALPQTATAGAHARALPQMAAAAAAAAPVARPTHLHGGGCPGSRLQTFTPPAAAPAAQNGAAPQSELTHWPVKLRLLPPQAPVLQNARLLIAADCVPTAYADFQRDLLRGRAVLIGCPKFDDLPAYVEKLTAIIALNDLEEIVVARMSVPCCMGITAAVAEARRRAGRDVPVTDVVIDTSGSVASRQTLPIHN